MSDELVVQDQEPLVPSFHAVAVNATEMQQSQAQIKGFLEEKVLVINQELTEMEKALESSKKRQWVTGPIYNQVVRIRQRHTYYTKLLAAVHAGFTIVPNMPCDMFAIRVSRPLPREGSQTNEGERVWIAPTIPLEKAESLALGDGRYESPQQRTYESHSEATSPEGKKIHKKSTIATRRWMDIEFPIAAAHPVVMDATGHALSLKIFDRIGLVGPGIRRRGDPIILGQIFYRSGYTEKVTSFLIAWHLDMRTL